MNSALSEILIYITTYMNKQAYSIMFIEQNNTKN